MKPAASGTSKASAAGKNSSATFRSARAPARGKSMSEMRLCGATWPGIATSFVASITLHGRGSSTFSPIAWIFPFFTRTVTCSFSSPVPVISLPHWIAT